VAQEDVKINIFNFICSCCSFLILFFLLKLNYLIHDLIKIQPCKTQARRRCLRACLNKNKSSK
jgi:hypothetical protein